MQINYKLEDNNLYVVLTVKRAYGEIWEKPEINIRQYLSDNLGRKTLKIKNSTPKGFEYPTDRLVIDNKVQQHLYSGKVDELSEIIQYCSIKSIAVKEGISRDLIGKFDS